MSETEKVSFEEFAYAIWNINALRFSKKVLASKIVSPYFINAGLARSYPQELKILSRAMKQLLLESPTPSPDFIAGIPERTTPLVTALSLDTNIPQITPNIKDPNWETNQELIGGGFKRGDSVGVFEDVLSSGGSLLKGVRILNTHGLEVVSAFSLVDRNEQNGRENVLKKVPYYKSFTTAENLIVFYHNEKIITPEQFNVSRAYIKF